MAAHEQPGRNTKKLIEAAVVCVDYGEPPPSELDMAWKCARWNTLPDAGGLYDQDAQLMHRMTVLLNIYEALSRFRSREGKQIHAMPHGERKIIGALRKGGFI